MTGIRGQIAFPNSRIPPHVAVTPDPGAGLPVTQFAGPLSHDDGEVAVVMTGRPSFTGTTDPAAAPRALAEAFRERGSPVLEDLRGPFSVIAVDRRKRSATIAIDRMGIERLTWGTRDGWLVVGTSADDVARGLDAQPAINRQSLFDFMYSHMVPAPATVFRGVSKLLPGQAIEISPESQRELRLWEPDFSRSGSTDVDELLHETRPVLRRAIERTGLKPSSGAFLSGGLDSSTVTGLLASVQEQPTRAFSVGFGVEEFDEMEFARAAAEQFDCKHLIYEVTPADIVELIPKIAAAYDEPFGNSSAVPTFCCARLAKDHGVDHLLAGDAGDELFGGNERYVRHRVFELYHRLPAWMQTAVLEPLAERLDPERGLLPLRKMSSYVRQARIPLPERFESWNLVYREGAERIFGAGFLESVDPDHVFKGMRAVWNSCPSDDPLDRMLWYDWKFTLADNDLRKVSRMCDLAGVRVSFPMLDEEFVEHSMKVPSDEKIRGYELRTFFKNAVRGFVPDKVISKTKHGFGLPFGVWLKTDEALKELVYGSIDRLRERDLFSPEFLDRVVAEHREGHAGYYGYAIWDLVMLEQWLEHHVG